MRTHIKYYVPKYYPIIILCGMLLISYTDVLCAGYVTGWQENMEAVRHIQKGLQEQGADRLTANLIREAVYFPVRGDLKHASEIWGFDDGYGEGRTYGGSRKHEGIDIMAVHAGAGRLKVQSVSDGTVEQMGWLELGGYRIGIRSASGIYYYYAHLDHYASGLQKGDKVQAGQLLGYMGDTGYGEEGTRGRFPVHLHFGIYYDRDGEERSVDPYFLLRYLEKKK